MQDIPALEEAAAEPAAVASAAPASVPATVSGPAPAAAAPSTFAEMRLKVGDPVHLEPPRRVAGGRATVTVLGWLEGRSVIVTAPENAAGRLVLHDGESVLLRAFTGRSAYAFRSTVLKAAHQPYHHLHLSFPDGIESVAIRASPRCRVRLPVRISAGDSAPGQGTILNIGTTGALIETAGAPGKEALVQLVFSLELHGVPVSLDLRAQICGAKGSPAGDGAPRSQFGVEFKELQPNDRLVLASLVWYLMHEHPRSVA